MPPKRKATAKAKKETPTKKIKKELANIKTALTKAPSFRKKVHTIDKHAIWIFSGGQVVDDFDCMLNQTNIGSNNNKFYVLQMIEHAGKYHVWTRWGRVGEAGMTLRLGPFSTQSQAETAFNKKFHDKTKNNWDNRDNFKPAKGKYTLLEMGNDDEEEEKRLEENVRHSKENEKFLPSKLPKETQVLMDLIFEAEMFNYALAQLKLDVKKLPLGQLSKPQIMKGFDVLEEVQTAITKRKTDSLSELSSKFYTIIPHDFGRQRPPTITTLDEIRAKMDMLLVLTDIESTQSLLKTTNVNKQTKSKVKIKEHPLDEKYDKLDVDLDILDPQSKEYKVIEEYVNNTKFRNIKIIHVWTVNRRSEGERFRVHKNIANRKLLWHGTNIAVIAAILKSGLRIMPHSGGRVGKGIYFGSENGTSAGYVYCNQLNLGIMFLNEVVLGKVKDIYMDDSTLVKPPPGFHSVVAQGSTEPDGKFDKHLVIENNKVVVSVGKPIKRNFRTNFTQSEYLIYQESQCRIRYLLLCQF